MIRAILIAAALGIILGFFGTLLFAPEAPMATRLNVGWIAGAAMVVLMLIARASRVTGSRSTVKDTFDSPRDFKRGRRRKRPRPED